jgi:PTS system beta-glucosides-specific IIC component
MRALGISTGITALLGITEPAMYGVTLRYRRPFVAVMIANAISGLFVGLFSLKMYAFAGPGVPGALGYFSSEDPNNFIFGMISLAVGAISSFILTWILTPKSILEEE